MLPTSTLTSAPELLRVLSWDVIVIGWLIVLYFRLFEFRFRSKTRGLAVGAVDLLAHYPFEDIETVRISWRLALIKGAFVCTAILLSEIGGPSRLSDLMNYVGL